MSGNFAEIIKYMPARLKNIFLNMEIGIIETIREIRMKTLCPVIVLSENRLCSVSAKSKLTDFENGITVYEEDIDYTYNMLIRESVYAYADQIVNCFVTVEGGHRVGISGTAVIKDKEITGLKDVNGIYFRIARECTGCSKEVLSHISNGYRVLNTVIAASPGKGKTTVLRDLASELSKRGLKVSIIDERHEIAAMNCGYSSFDIFYCDVLDGFPKAEGIERAVRTLSPDIIVFDELGNIKESESVSYALNCGVGFITSVHAKSIEELLRRPILKNLFDIKAIDAVVLYELGKVRDIRYLRGENFVKSSCFELDLRNVCNNGVS